MADTTDRYALPFIQTAQAQKDVTHNEALGLIDTLLHLAVEDVLAAAPAAPLAGQNWIVANGATGAWAGRDGQLAAFTTAGWSYVLPRDGCIALVRSAGVFTVRTGGAWHPEAWPARALLIGGRTMLGGAVGPVATPLGGTVVDAEARATINAIVTLLRAMGLATAP